MLCDSCSKSGICKFKEEMETMTNQITELQSGEEPEIVTPSYFRVNLACEFYQTNTAFQDPLYAILWQSL